MKTCNSKLLSRTLILIALASGLTACGGGGGDSPAPATSFTVSATSADANGAISPASATVNKDGTASFTVTPAANFEIDAVSGCGGSLSGNTYTTGAITANCTVTASFVAIPSFTVTASAGANGSVSPDSTSVNQGGTTSITVTPGANFEIDSVSGCGGSLSGNTYTTGAITANCTVTASFVAATFTVSTSAGSGGTIDPARTVDSGATALFLVLPNAGFRYDTVTGCGGTLDGNTALYQTAPVTADCTITAAFVPLENFNAVAPLYPVNGANWNDYVVGDANGAIDSPCVPANLVSCLHGGESRVVTATGLTSCTDLAAIDSLGAFTWECSINSGGTAQFISTGLADGRHLSDLLDTSNFTTPVFRPNFVTVSLQGSAYGQTASSTWWNNPLENLSFSAGGPSLTGPGNIYVITTSSIENFTLDADKVSLVIMPNITLSGPGNGQNSYVIESINNDYLWLEGSIDAAGDDIGVRLESVRYSVLRNVASNNANDGNNNNNTNFDIGINLQNSLLNRLEDITANNNVSSGIYLNGGSENNVLSRITANANLYGVLINNGSNNLILSDVTASNNTDTGVWMDSNSTGAILDTIVANDNTGSGVFLSDGASNNFLVNVTALRNGTGVSLFVVSGIVVGTVNASNSTTGHGITLVGASNNIFSDVTANNNASVGISLNLNVNNAGDDDYSDFNSFTTVTATGNDIGILLFDSSDNTFSGLDVTNNTTVNCAVTPPTGTEGGRVPGDAGLDNNCSPTP